MPEGKYLMTAEMALCVYVHIKDEDDKVGVKESEHAKNKNKDLQEHLVKICLIHPSSIL